MFKRLLKWLLRVIAVLFLIAAVFVVNAVWFRPWSLNVFYEKVFIAFMLDNPELLSQIGLVERFGITGHNARLTDESPGYQQRNFERLRRNVADLRSYSLEKQNASQRLSTAISIGSSACRRRASAFSITTIR